MTSNWFFDFLKQFMSNTNNDAFAAMRYSEFRQYITSRFLLTIALQMQNVLLGWRIYELSNDPLALGVVGLAEAIPAISVALYAGYVVDKSDKRNSYLWVCGLYALFVGLFGLATARHIETLTDHKTIIWGIYGLIFLWGIVRGFSMPAGFSLMASLIPKSESANAASWSTTSWQIGAIIGPALGGGVYAWYGVEAAFGVALVLTLVAVVNIYFVSPKPPKPVEIKETLTASITKGLQFVFNSPIILGALSLDLFSVLFGGVTALLPIFANDILKAGPEGLGILRAAPSVGAALMLIWLTYYPPLRHTGYKLLGAVAMFGVTTILFAWSVNFYWSVLLLALGGAFDAVSVQIRHTILQLTIPDDMRGRVSSVNMIFISSSNEIGAFESGAAARLMGLIPSVVFGGCMTLLVVAGTYIKAPTLRKFSMKKY